MFSKSAPVEPTLERLPSGSFTVDKSGHVVASTLPHSFPPARVKEIGVLAVKILQGAAQQQMPLRELSINYAGLKLTVREARGGAIVFLAPRGT
jgi:hypothetical protein